MQIIEQSHHVLSVPMQLLETLEAAGRTCYKSEDKITAGSAEKFVKMLIGRGHHAMIEFGDIIIRFITNRGVTHEMVRHRLCSFAQESTRYVRYDGNMEFIRPAWWANWAHYQQNVWMMQMEAAEGAYQELLQSGAQPQEAREVLPNSLKTEIVVKGNIREWRHIFLLRCSKAAHPQMRALMLPCMAELKSMLPVVFDDIES